MIMMWYSKELMNYWNKLKPTDENVSRLYYVIRGSGVDKNKQDTLVKGIFLEIYKRGY